MKNFIFSCLLLSSFTECSHGTLSLCDTGESGVMSSSRSGFRPANHINFKRHEISLAAKLADLAYKVYGDVNLNLEEFQEDGYLATPFYGETGHTALTNYFVARSKMGLMVESETEIIVALRGSVSKADMLTDAYIWNSWLQKEAFNGEEKGRVHVGFNRTFESFKDELSQLILSALCKGKRRVTFVGHSMGGALANLAALYFARLAQEKEMSDLEIKLVSFNAPRLGSKNFADKLHELIGKQNIARFTTGTREGVSTFILGSFGFKHAGTNIVVTKASNSLLSDHKMACFLGGAAELAFALHNAVPEKVNGFKTQLSMSKITAVKQASFYHIVVTRVVSSNYQLLKDRFWALMGYGATSRT